MYSPYFCITEKPRAEELTPEAEVPVTRQSGPQVAPKEVLQQKMQSYKLSNTKNADSSTLNSTRQM